MLQAAEERRKAGVQAKEREARRKANLTEMAGGSTAGAGTETLKKYGIGLKLLQKMGYKAGEGLGANKQGIAKPIEATMRAKGAGLGLGGEQHKRSSVAADGARPSAAAPAAQAAAPPPEAKLWKRKNQEERVKREYKSAQQVLAESAEKPLAAQPIIDMRGPQARVVTNMEHLNMQQEEEGHAAAGGPPMPELQHNLQLLVDLTEADIRKLDARLQHEQDTATILAKDKQRLETEVERQADALQRLAEVQEEVARWQVAGAQAALPELQSAYSSLKQRCPEEYVLYGLTALALAQALPRLAALMHGWSPLAAPSQGLEEFSAWRPLLQSDAQRSAVLSTAATNVEADPFALLSLEVLLPPLRSAVLNQWQPRDPEPLLSLVELWAPVLPPVVLHHLLDSSVMPKIRAAVDSWEPRKETVPIHAWIHPWLPHLGQQLEQVYPTIRHRLGAALAAWHPSDSSALVLLSPWRRVFEPAEWDALLARSIMPKLAFALQELVINPAAQQLEPFQWVMAWHGALAPRQLVALLEQGFFPKWHQVLHHWLQHKPNYDEVTRWYLGWKSLFPQDLLDSERVRTQFNYALDLMNSAVDGAPLPPYQPPLAAAAPPLSSAAYGVPPAAATQAPPPSAAYSSAAADLTMKDLVQRFAEEHGVDFLPKGRFVDGQPVYSFGGVSVLLDSVQGAIRAQIRDRWAPVSLERLLQEHAAKASGA